MPEMSDLLAIASSPNASTAALLAPYDDMDRQRQERQRGRDDSDVAPAALQVWGRVLEGAEDAVHVDVEDPLERRVVRLADRSVCHDACVRDE